MIIYVEILEGFELLQNFGGPLTLYLIEMTFNTFANRADPDQAALVRAAWSGSTLFAYGNMIYLILHKRTWQVISLCYVRTWKFIRIIIHSGLSLPWMFMKERFKYDIFLWKYDMSWYLHIDLRQVWLSKKQPFTYLGGVLFVEQRQTAQTQIRRRRMWRLISVSTVCLQNVLVWKKMQNTTSNP